MAFKPPDVPSKKLFGWEMPWCAAATTCHATPPVHTLHGFGLLSAADAARALTLQSLPPRSILHKARNARHAIARQRARRCTAYVAIACMVCRRWIHPVLYVTTEDIFIAAGFDAVIMLKTIEFGVQLFGPLAIVCLVIRAISHIRLILNDRARARSLRLCMCR